MILLYIVQGPSTMNILLATSAGLSRHLNENTTVSLAKWKLQSLLVAEAVCPPSFKGLCI